VYMVWMISLNYCGALIFCKFLQSFSLGILSKAARRSRKAVNTIIFFFFAVARMCRRIKRGWGLLGVPCGQKPNWESGIWCLARAQSINKSLTTFAKSL